MATHVPSPHGIRPIRLVLAVCGTAVVIQGAFIAWLASRWAHEPQRPAPALVYRSAEAIAAADGVSLPAILQTQVHVGPDEELSMTGWIRLLQDQGVRVCGESLPSPDGEFRVRVAGGTYSVAKLLDTLVRFDRRYTWELLEGNELLNVIPRASQLDTPVGSHSYQGMPLGVCIEIPAVNAKARFTVRPPFHFGPPRPPSMAHIYEWPFDMNVQNATHRDYLNLLALQYEGMTWQVDHRNVLQFRLPQEQYEATVQRLRADTLASVKN